MKLRKLARQLAAAAVAGAMTLSLCTPALAAAPELPEFPAELSEENTAPESTQAEDPAASYGITVTYKGTAVPVTEENAANVLGEGNPTVSVMEITDTAGTKVYQLSGSHVNDSLKIDVEGATCPVDIILTAINKSYAVHGRLETNGVRNVTVKGGGSYGAISSDAEINCTGDVNITNETSIAVGSGGYGFKVDGAKDVTITANGYRAIACDATINCTGEVKITNKSGKAVDGKLTVGNDTIKATNVTVEGREDGYTVSSGAAINCTGNVNITNEIGGAVGYSSDGLIVNGAENVKITANKYCAVNSDAVIDCTGKVTLTSLATKAVDSAVTYTQSNSKAYTVEAGKSIDVAAKLEDVGEKNTTFELKPVPDDYYYICITPVDEPHPDTPSGGDNVPSVGPSGDDSGDLGAVVAGVAIGGATLWGGYEVATRVILNKLLPEGAAIPANRGQLALLVWNNAGRPEPAAQPAFADVADADMAKAAQWCTEQGIMEAKSADTFKPEGRTPKFKVIETWNKAFPKAK